MSTVDAAVRTAKASHERFLEDYVETLRIPSVSTLPEHKDDVAHCAQWFAEQLTHAGLDHIAVMPTAGHPVVYGEWLHAPGKPTMLVYGHYDVQPGDPFDEWESGPFEPEVRDDYIYARGASDMKGQILAQIKALESWTAQNNPPFNIKYMIEGEEEIGSEHLEAFIDANRDLLKCDFVLNCDAGIQSRDQPGITYSLRGLAYIEVELRGPAKDLHSGRFGGTVPNPINEMAKLIAGMHDADGRVTLPGFYDKVREMTPQERTESAKLPYSDEHWLDMSASNALQGETGFTTLERVGARPCLDVNGIWGGYMGPGAKTVLPAKATAKISTRLVADQDHREIPDMFRAYFDANVPEGMQWSVRDLHGGPGALMNLDSPYMQAAVRALKTTFGKDTFFTREGGSVPVVGMLKEKLGVDTIMLGFALPDDGIHGPNERQYLPNFYRGIETYIHFLGELAK